MNLPPHSSCKQFKIYPDPVCLHLLFLTFYQPLSCSSQLPPNLPHSNRAQIRSRGCWFPRRIVGGAEGQLEGYCGGYWGDYHTSDCAGGSGPLIDCHRWEPTDHQSPSLQYFGLLAVDTLGTFMATIRYICRPPWPPSGKCQQLLIRVGAMGGVCKLSNIA